MPYYPGCTVKTTAKNFEISAIESMKVLGVELVEIPKWTCCGTVFSLARDDVMRHIAPIRNLIRVQEMNETRVVTICSMCYNTLKRANQLVKSDPEKLATANRFMNEEEDYRAEVTVYHLLEILRDDIGFEEIKKHVKKPLKGLKVVPYYGCLLVRPKSVAIDDTENPMVMHELMKALGAEVIDDPMKVECCGAYHTVEHKKIVAERTYKIISSAKSHGGDILVLSCPLCDYNLDFRQKEAKELHPDFEQMPVMYFTQLMALAFGLDEKAIGFEYHYVDPRPILKEKNLL
ncbi:MAG: CoB--CoM heterodisulfide reductase iron-sulfur subunit B family protein [Candidatus Asgardarchaeia archaeon]